MRIWDRGRLPEVVRVTSHSMMLRDEYLVNAAAVFVRQRLLFFVDGFGRYSYLAKRALDWSWAITVRLEAMQATWGESISGARVRIHNWIFGVRLTKKSVDHYCAPVFNLGFWPDAQINWPSMIYGVSLYPKYQMKLLSRSRIQSAYICLKKVRWSSNDS